MNQTINFSGLLASAVTETGAALSKTSDELAAYVAQRAGVLAAAYGQPGYEMAVAAERDAVALWAGMAGVAAAKAADQRLLGVIQGALSIGAQAMVLA